MTRYSHLWHEEKARADVLARKLKAAEEQRDKYISFIRDTKLQTEFLRWLAPQIGLKIEDVMPDTSGNHKSET